MEFEKCATVSVFCSTGHIRSYVSCSADWKNDLFKKCIGVMTAARDLIHDNSFLLRACT